MNIKIDVYASERYDKDWPSDNAVEFLAWLKEKIDSVPEELRASVFIDIENDDERASIDIYYYRAETDQEEKARLSQAKIVDDREASKRELELYIRLRRKYGQQ